jgi:hypothetical protein
VIPLAARLAQGLSRWLFVGDEAAIELQCNLDDLDALAADREALWAPLDGASFLTRDEKRGAAGYAPIGAAEGKFNPYHDDAGRFTFAPGGGVTPVAGKPRGVGPPKPPPLGEPAKPVAPPRADYGATPRGRPFTEHGRDNAKIRDFSDERIDAIVDNNARTRVGKVDSNGRKTWVYTDARGNTVVTNESGGVVTVFSFAPGGKYIEKP